MGNRARRQRARANLIERCSPIARRRPWNKQEPWETRRQFAGHRSPLTSEPGLYRFYLQLIADFWGRILVRRMKTFAVAILTFGLGLVTGLQIGNHFIVGTVRNQFRSSSAQHQSLALVSVHALDELQTGHVESAKSFLAREVGYYYRSIQQFDPPSPQKQELLHHIEASSASSPELKDALSRKTQ